MAHREGAGAAPKARPPPGPTLLEQPLAVPEKGRERSRSGRNNGMRAVLGS
ncbi:hypothetical protein GCM10007921_04110 [Tritonibacter mobilis]|nr:hypothetical protein GCM10007921_04110 [Tritonibacter mobilis]